MIAVVINVYREPKAQVEACLGRVVANLRDSRVGVFLNGPDANASRKVVERFGCTAIASENLGTNERWHLWWTRMLEFLSGTGCEVCFKFDPDTMVDAPPQEIPTADYFGCPEVSARYQIPFVQGGITGFSRRAVLRILDSGVLTPGDGKPWIEPPGWDVLADDQHLALALASIGIHPTPWPECLSQWKIQVLNDPIRHAIVHPRCYRRW